MGRREEKRRMESSVYDLSSPFPPTEKQVKLCGRILSNSIAALYAQQAPPPEISYAAVVAEELASYTRPIIDFAMHEFRHQCNFRKSGDFNFSKAAANKALDTLDKILLINEHYQLMFDVSVWDVLNPASLNQLKQLSSRYPYQPISESLKKDVERYKNQIHEQLISIKKSEHDEFACNEDEHIEDDDIPESERPPIRYFYPQHEKYYQLENNIVFNVRGGKFCEESNAKDFQISVNELIAFQINREAKFTKVFIEGVSRCFLMPAEFRDDTMRNFFRVKFEEFVDSTGNFTGRDDDMKDSLSPGPLEVL